MIVRLLAALFTLGLLVGAAEAREPAAASTIVLVDSGTSSEGVDSADAADELDAIALVLDPREPACTLVPIISSTAPPHDAPCIAVFRPPRSYAFN